MDHGYVFGTNHFVDGRLLGRIEIGKSEGGEGELFRFAARVDEVAKFGKAPFGLDGAVEGLKHGAVGCLVEGKHHSGRAPGRQPPYIGAFGDGGHHAVAVDEADGACEGKRRLSPVALRDDEEGYRTTVFEVMVGFLISPGGAGELGYSLVEGLVVDAAYGDAEPCVAPLGKPREADARGKLGEGALLLVVFHLKEHALLLKRLQW